MLRKWLIWWQLYPAQLTFSRRAIILSLWYPQFMTYYISIMNKRYLWSFNVCVASFSSTWTLRCCCNQRNSSPLRLVQSAFRSNWLQGEVLCFVFFYCRIPLVYLVELSRRDSNSTLHSTFAMYGFHVSTLMTSSLILQTDMKGDGNRLRGVSIRKRGIQGTCSLLVFAFHCIFLL